jgi:hypothetical protein
MPFWVPLLLLILTPGSPARETAADRRASIVCNLSKFVVWPPEADGKAEEIRTFCLLGEDPIALELDRLFNRIDAEKNGEFRRIGGPAEIRGCHVLFVSSEQETRLPDLLDRLTRQPVFTVSDIPGFARMGGMVEILSTTDRVYFRINLDAAKRAGLIIKAPLLQIARVIQGVE